MKGRNKHRGSPTIKYQRDKQIIFVYRVDNKLFNLSVGY